MELDSDLCPECRAPLIYDEVDVGVGVIRGNRGCDECGWSPPSREEDW